MLRALTPATIVAVDRNKAAPGLATEWGAEQDGVAMTREAGSYSVIGYGGGSRFRPCR